MQDPFYHKERRPKQAKWLDADAWLDSAMYEFWQTLGRGYTRFQDFMSIFHVSGIRRLFVELFSDALSLGVIGMVLMAALAIPAFQLTASGKVNKAENISVTFLDRYGQEVGRRGIRTDDSVSLDKLPDYLVKATLATEDRRFYDHFGVDVIGTLRALVNNAGGDNGTQGGSSITQQLAKNLFLTSERSLDRKIKEAFLAVWLESHYSKDEILKLYFDKAYMGGGAFGVAAAAEYYFGKKITDISLAEAAMLAGMFKAPTNYSPLVDLGAARARANVVLTNLVDSGFLTEGQVTAARRNPATPVERLAEANSPNYFLDYAFEEVKKAVTASGTSSNSFVVRTTIDPVLQNYAEDAIASTIRDQGEQYRVSEGAMVVTEPNGQIRAMVGGLDYGKSQFNRAIVSNRQPGSSFKPIVYATWFENNPDQTPQSRIVDQRVCIGDWCPENYGRSFKGRITLASAIAQSLNSVPVQMSIKLGRKPIADNAHLMGITSDFEITRSLALGTANVSVIDMASVYSVFASGGYKTPAYGITKISSLRGEVIEQVDPDAVRERVLPEDTVVKMDQMMYGVVQGGTGTRAKIEGVPVLGKTGTTNSYRDAWFCGFTGNYVAAVWLGNDDYGETNNLTGGTLPAIAWQKFMAYAHTNVEIKPVLGVDFKPSQTVIADAAGAAAPVVEERPPTLQPEAAQKLLDLADALRNTLAATRPVAQETTLPAAAAGESL